MLARDPHKLMEEINKPCPRGLRGQVFNAVNAAPVATFCAADLTTGDSI